MGKKLFVGGLSWDTTDQSLRTAFEAFGEILDAKVILDRETGRSRGFGFVTVAEDETTKKAVESMNGAQLDGRAIRVNEAEERNTRTRSSSPPPVQRRGSYGGPRGDARGTGGGSYRQREGGGGYSSQRRDSGDRGGGWRPPPDGATSGGIPFDPGPSGRTDEAYKRKKEKKKRRSGGNQYAEAGDSRDRSSQAKRKSGRSWRDLGSYEEDDE
jgi:RNA recognition motif-containing protein